MEQAILLEKSGRSKGVCHLGLRAEIQPTRIYLVALRVSTGNYVSQLNSILQGFKFLICGSAIDCHDMCHVRNGNLSLDISHIICEHPVLSFCFKH